MKEVAGQNLTDITELSCRPREWRTVSSNSVIKRLRAASVFDINIIMCYKYDNLVIPGAGEPFSLQELKLRFVDGERGVQ